MLYVMQIGNAVKSNPAFLELKRIDTARDVAQTVAKSSNKVVLSSESLLLNLAVYVELLPIRGNI